MKKGARYNKPTGGQHRKWHTLGDLRFFEVVQAHRLRKDKRDREIVATALDEVDSLAATCDNLSHLAQARQSGQPSENPG